MSKDWDYLTTTDLVEIANGLIPGVQIRDLGALESASQRPTMSAFGEDAYPDFATKVAALLHSLARNNPLIDGNKRLAWGGARIFCLMNGFDLSLSVDDAERLIVGVAVGDITITQLSQVIADSLVLDET